MRLYVFINLVVGYFNAAVADDPVWNGYVRNIGKVLFICRFFIPHPARVICACIHHGNIFIEYASHFLRFDYLFVKITQLLIVGLFQVCDDLVYLGDIQFTGCRINQVNNFT